MTAEKSLSEKIAAAEVYKSNISLLEQQEEFLKTALDDFLVARETLRRYADAEEGDELLVPIGGNTFIHAKAAGTGKVLRGIGNDLVVENNMEKAMERLTEQIEEMGDSIQKVSGKIVDMQRKLQVLTAEIQREYQAMEQGAATQG